MNQRQRKKTSQGKKRYHEAAKKQEAHTKVTSPPQKPGESKPVKPPVRDVSSDPQTKRNESGAQGGQSVKSYSKRKIASNWSRYQEGEDGDEYSHSSQTEEELQLRLLQLFNLPTQSLSTHTEPDPLATDPKQSTNYITLDCNALAESLATLPLHQRLGLNEALLENREYFTTARSQVPDNIQAATIKPHELNKRKEGAQCEEEKVRPLQELAVKLTTAMSTASTTIDDKPPTKHTGGSHDDSPAAVVSDSRTEEVAQTTCTSKTEQTDELDDMLDELLA